MLTTRISRYLRRSDTSPIALPKMAVYASCLMLPIFFWLYQHGSHRTAMGIVATQKLPATHIIACKGPTEFAVISLNQQGQFAFSVLSISPLVQSAAIQSVAQCNGITLDTTQLRELQSLPFLATSVVELPRLLAWSYHRRSQLSALANLESMSEEQAIACAVAVRQFNKALFQRPTHISLRIDTEANSGKVMRLIEHLQEQGFARISYQNQFLDQARLRLTQTSTNRHRVRSSYF